MKKLLFLLSLVPLILSAKNLPPEGFWDIQDLSNPLIDQQGKNIIFMKKRIDKQNDKFVSELWLTETDGSNQRFFTKGSSPKWFPDAKKIAFIKKDENEIAQVFSKSLGKEGTSQITTHETDVKEFSISPDGKLICFSAFHEYDDDWVVDIPGRKKGKQYNWTDEPKVVNTLHWRYDGKGELESGENHLHLIGSNGGASKKISDWGVDYVSDLSWQDHETVIFTGNGELNDMLTPWKQTSIFSLHLGTKEVNRISPLKGVYTRPEISKNGKKISFLGHSSRDFSSNAFDLWVYSNDLSRRITTNLSSTPSKTVWLSDNEIVLNLDEKGSRKLKLVDIRNSKTRDLGNNFKDQFFLASAYGKKLIGTLATADRPSEIAIFNGKSFEKITKFNELLLNQYELGKTIEINYKSKDNLDIQGWYILPPEFREDKKYPLVLIIHGGPHAMYRAQFNYLWHQFASDGYVVLFTNPRGSTGYGSKFANIIDNDYPGEGDLADLLNGVDQITRMGFINENKMYVQGCSGGGILTAWVVAHDDRFAAAASLCPVTNWISMVGTTDIPAWTFEWFDVPYWEDPSSWLDRSPIMRTGHIKTPTLMMTGIQDLRTPMAQTEEMFVALKQAGVPTTLIRMNGEWHGTGRRKPTNWFRTYRYLSEWYNKYER
ncbi:MAG: peptidase S9 [Gammaproteobacteria bacterium]|nr:peptidase S9 [Gammaproteobacteria bacterium]